jgi:hypothetical protein
VGLVPSPRWSAANTRRSVAVEQIPPALLLAIIGVAIELAVRRAGGLGTAIGIAALGVAAAFLGGADDAPGLVLLGLVLVATAFAIGMRTRARADGV